MTRSRLFSLLLLPCPYSSQAVNLLSLLPHNPSISLPTVSILHAVAVGRLLRFLFPYLSLALIPEFSLLGGLVCSILSLASIRCDTLALACTSPVKPGTHARCYLYSLLCLVSPLLTTPSFQSFIPRHFDCDRYDLKGKKSPGRRVWIVCAQAIVLYKSTQRRRRPYPSFHSKVLRQKDDDHTPTTSAVEFSFHPRTEYDRAFPCFHVPRRLACYSLCLSGESVSDLGRLGRLRTFDIARQLPGCTDITSEILSRPLCVHRLCLWETFGSFVSDAHVASDAFDFCRSS